MLSYSPKLVRNNLRMMKHRISLAVSLIHTQLWLMNRKVICTEFQLVYKHNWS